MVNSVGLDDKWKWQHPAALHLNDKRKDPLLNINTLYQVKTSGKSYLTEGILHASSMRFLKMKTCQTERQKFEVKLN